MASTRKLGVAFARMRCRMPMPNFYFHRSGLPAAPQCFYCNEPRIMKHVFIERRRFVVHRKILLERPLRQHRLIITLPVILSLGPSLLRHCNRNICDAIFNFVRQRHRHVNFIVLFSSTFFFHLPPSTNILSIRLKLAVRMNKLMFNCA